MSFKKILYTVMLAAGSLSASAQTAQADSVDVFNHHWFVQGQFGAQYSLGELKFGDLISPTAQIAAGYQFTPTWGLRLAVNGWQAKAGSTLQSSGNVYKWKYNYVAPTVDVTCDLVNLIRGYKAGRLVSAGLLAGIGANIAWNNDEAFAANAQILQTEFPNVSGDVAFLDLLWGGTKARFAGKVGAFCDFHVSKRVDVGVEINANTLSDSYNSKKASNTDWYFNGLLGVKVHLGKVTKRVKADNPCGEIVVEKVVERPVEKVVYKDNDVAPVEVKHDPLRREIFFVIRGTKVSKNEMYKVEDIAKYLNKYPSAKVSITGYADKGTGNAQININYARSRAKSVADLLVEKFGISSERIIVDSKGDVEQPFEVNENNRVTICIAE